MLPFSVKESRDRKMEEEVQTRFRRLKEEFDLPFELKPEQCKVISKVLQGQKCVAILPTGYGKSMCYILPTLMKKREKWLTLVVSPLNSLMVDQTEILTKFGIKSLILPKKLPEDSVEETLKDYAYDGDILVDNRIVELYTSSTDEKTQNRILNCFREKEGKIRVLVATIAFGMGLNITDIDIIVNWGAPKTVMSFWQEVGRCGRDGRQAWNINYPYGRSLSPQVTDKEVALIMREKKTIAYAVKF
ncbi:recQ [Mytilus edulis]|uniref:DNA 3'-5' helicase n=1 Tax=Mytilus edulis TaxID=6550 RepID=A0A8S3TE61_MYTED|nr:recQ [Mytilus edulis]